jgi:hypothetical protein
MIFGRLLPAVTSRFNQETGSRVVCSREQESAGTEMSEIRSEFPETAHNTEARNRNGSGQTNRHIQTDNNVSKEEFCDSEHYRGDTL